MTTASLFLSHPSHEENVADTRSLLFCTGSLLWVSDLGKENRVPPAEMMEAPSYVCISDQTERRLEIPAFPQESNKDGNE